MCSVYWHEIRTLIDCRVWRVPSAPTLAGTNCYCSRLAASRRCAMRARRPQPWLQLKLVVCRFLPTLNLAGETRNHRGVLPDRIKIARFVRIVVQIVQLIQIPVAQAKLPTI